MNTLNHYLQSAGIKQADFAEAVGVGQAMISRLARGLATPSIRVATKIQQVSGGAVPVQSWAHPPAHDHAAPVDQGGAA